MACKSLKLSTLSIHGMIAKAMKKVFITGGIQDRLVTRLTYVSFEQSHKNTAFEERVTQKQSEFVFECQMNFSKHMLAEEHLYNCILSIFRPIQWSNMLFQRTQDHEIASVFGQKLIYAAANHDMHKSAQKGLVIYSASRNKEFT